jgi:hypothetical protein
VIDLWIPPPLTHPAPATPPAGDTAEGALSTATDHEESRAMTILSDAEHRTAIIDGLRRLATYLENHPDIPVGLSVTMHYSASARVNDDEQARAEVARIAALLEVLPEASEHGHYTATKQFGPVRYTTHAVPKAALRVTPGGE